MLIIKASRLLAITLKFIEEALPNCNLDLLLSTFEALINISDLSELILLKSVSCLPKKVISFALMKALSK